MRLHREDASGEQQGRQSLRSQVLTGTSLPDDTIAVLGHADYDIRLALAMIVEAPPPLLL